MEQQTNNKETEKKNGQTAKEMELFNKQEISFFSAENLQNIWGLSFSKNLSNCSFKS